MSVHEVTEVKKCPLCMGEITPGDPDVDYYDTAECLFCSGANGPVPYDQVKPGWYFWDEVGYDRMGPYDTQELAERSLEGYAAWLDSEDDRPPNTITRVPAGPNSFKQHQIRAREYELRRLHNCLRISIVLWGLAVTVAAVCYVRWLS